jgi:hypothetical protein
VKHSIHDGADRDDDDLFYESERLNDLDSRLIVNDGLGNEGDRLYVTKLIGLQLRMARNRAQLPIADAP